MKAEELMIGDWVFCTYPSIKKSVRVEEIRTVGDDELKIIISDDMLRLVFAERYIEPIPLTSEILEKNGFRNGKLNVSPQYCFEEGHIFIGVTLEATPDRQEGITVYKNRNSLQYEGKIEFVHELQHALRLCRIEKEIVI